MTNSIEIGICHWDGFVTENKKCSLIDGARECRKLGVKNIKIYCGNKVEATYSDLSNSLSNANTLCELLRHNSYTELFNLGFDVIVIVMFSITNNHDDDYWRTSFPHCDETQFRDACEYLKTFPNTEFILSNWESDHVYNASNDKQLIKTSLINLINTRKKACTGSNIKVAIEINNVKCGECVMNDVIPNVDCDMVSYSCYDTQEIPESFSHAIDKIRRKMKPNMSLYIGEFGFPINKMRKDKVNFLYENMVKIFREKGIKLAFYWNLYDNEKNLDGTFSGFGLITPYGKFTFVAYKVFNKRNIIFVRHGYSIANKWKDENGICHIDKHTAENQKLYNPCLCQEGVDDTIKYCSDFWKFIDENSSDMPIKIFCSPLRRALQTLLLCLKKGNMTNVSVYISPLLAEIGDSCENRDKLYDVRMEPILMDISRLVHDIHFMHNTKDRYTKVMNNGSNSNYIKEFVQLVKTDEKFTGCCVVCFSHHSTILTISEQELANFGRGNFITGFTC